MAWTVRPRCSATSGDGEPVEVAQREGRRGGGRRGGRAPRGRRRRRGARPTDRRRARLVGDRSQVPLVARLPCASGRRACGGPRRSATPSSACGTVPFCTAATAARNVSAVRSSATVGPSHRRTQVAVHLAAAPCRRARAGPAPGRTALDGLAHGQIIVASRLSDVCARKRPHADEPAQTSGSHRAGLASRPSKRPAGRTLA